MEKRRTALIVDDHRILRELYRAVLETEGLSSAETSNGAEALFWLERKTPDIILVDLDMPVMDGRGFLEYRMREPRIRRIPVLVVSGRLEDGTLRSSLSRLGAGQMLHKPVECDELIGAVRKLLGNSDIPPDFGPSVAAEGDSVRQDPRVAFAVPVLIHTRQAGDVAGCLHDLSAGGLGAYLAEPLPHGEQVIVRLEVEGRSVSLPGCVQWVNESRTPAGYRHGIRFVERQADTFPLSSYSVFRSPAEGATPRPGRHHPHKKPKSLAA